MLLYIDGKYIVERPEYKTEEDEMTERFNARFGVGNWRWADRICSYVDPACGYGEPLDKTNCLSCDGKCVRPKTKFAGTKQADDIHLALGILNSILYMNGLDSEVDSRIRKAMTILDPDPLNDLSQQYRAAAQHSMADVFSEFYGGGQDYD